MDRNLIFLKFTIDEVGHECKLFVEIIKLIETKPPVITKKGFHKYPRRINMAKKKKATKKKATKKATKKKATKKKRK